MSKAITEVHEIKVYNESTRLFLVKSFYCYELYISNMQEYMSAASFLIPPNIQPKPPNCGVPLLTTTINQLI